MPVTPFHFGAGLALKGCAPRGLSWVTFCATQVVIDCETLFHLLRQEYPVHRVVHTFVGAGIAGLATSLLFLSIVRALRGRPWAHALVDSIPGIARTGEGSVTGILVGGLTGGLTHPFLDGLMHRDVQPFLPWSPSNPFLGAISVTALHEFCLAGAGVGVGLLLLRARFSRRQVQG